MQQGGSGKCKNMTINKVCVHDVRCVYSLSDVTEDKNDGIAANLGVVRRVFQLKT